MKLSPNLATRFAFIGAAIAAVIAIFVFGWFWVYLPGTILTLAVIYLVSTGLGHIASARARGTLGCMLAGSGVALATFFTGVIAFGMANVLLAWLEHALRFDIGMGPFTSPGHAVLDFIVKPLYWVSIPGGVIAVILGLAYGARLHAQRRSDQDMNSRAGAG